jgi:hypothetical protein
MGDIMYDEEILQALDCFADSFREQIDKIMKLVEKDHAEYEIEQLITTAMFSAAIMVSSLNNLKNDTLGDDSDTIMGKISELELFISEQAKKEAINHFMLRLSGIKNKLEFAHSRPDEKSHNVRIMCQHRQLLNHKSQPTPKGVNLTKQLKQKKLERIKKVVEKYLKNNMAGDAIDYLTMLNKDFKWQELDDMITELKEK